MDKDKYTGYGLAHILDKHPNFDLNLIEKIIKNGKIVKNNNTNTIWANFEGKIYKLGLSNGWKGKGKNNWIITSYEATRKSDKTFGDALFTDKRPLSNLDKIDYNTKLKNNQLNEPLKEFGKNYAEFYHNSKGAIEKLLKKNKLSKKANTTKNDIIKENYFFETHLNTLTQNSLKNQANKPLIISFKNEDRLIKDLRKDLKENLIPLINMQIINKETNLKGIITQKEVNKISSSKEIQKSLNNGFSKKEHFEVAKKIKNLFENATLIQTHKDIKNKENILLIYKFTKDLIINNKNAKAKITLFEKIQGKNKIYTIELDSLENPTP
ncbi:hypothetical protein FMM56_06145 [Campylobacter sp. LR264d]|nr:hypothetical protein FMM56_06145 [Campylobacter sp. LR264d]